MTQGRSISSEIMSIKVLYILPDSRQFNSILVTHMHPETLNDGKVSLPVQFHFLVLNAPGEPLMAVFLSLSICSLRVTQDVSTVWSGTRKESKYELEHLGGPGGGRREAERRGLSFFFIDLGKRVGPREKRLPLSAMTLHLVHRYQHTVKQ